MAGIQGRFDTNVITGETVLIVADDIDVAIFEVHPDTPMPSDVDLRKMLALARGRHRD